MLSHSFYFRTGELRVAGSPALSPLIWVPALPGDSSDGTAHHWPRLQRSGWARFV